MAFTAPFQETLALVQAEIHLRRGHLDEVPSKGTAGPITHWKTPTRAHQIRCQPPVVPPVVPRQLPPRMLFDLQSVGRTFVLSPQPTSRATSMTWSSSAY